MITVDACLPEGAGAEFCPRLAKLGGMLGAAAAIAACTGPKPGGRSGAREAETALGAEAGTTADPAGAAAADSRAWAANGACRGKRRHWRALRPHEPTGACVFSQGTSSCALLVMQGR